MPVISAKVCKCIRKDCGHVWLPRKNWPVEGKGKVELPRCCAGCKSPFWNEPADSSSTTKVSRATARSKKKGNRRHSSPPLNLTLQLQMLQL